MRTFLLFIALAFMANVFALHKVDLMRKNRSMFLRSSMMSKVESSGIHGSNDSNVYMYGSLNVTFEYYAAIELGSDKQLFAVQVDTGSASLAIPASGCEQYTQSGSSTGQSCAHADDFYDQSLSSDSSDVQCNAQCRQCSSSNLCEFELAYGDGSFLIGTLVTDLVTMGPLSTNAAFGQIKIESEGFAATDVDGILGMAYHTLDSVDGDDIFGKFVSAGQTENSFSMCLGNYGGLLVFGGVDESYNAAPLVYTPITSETYYVVEMEDLLVNGVSIGVPPIVYNENNTIVDSGTTLLAIPPEAFNALASVLINYCPSSISSICQCTTSSNCLFSGGQCFSISSSIVNQFPNISIVLSNTGPLTITPQQYFLNVQGGYCFGIMEVDGLGTILGDVFMQAFNIHFDRENKRVGFAPVANCGAPEITLAKGSGDDQTVQYKFTMKNPLSVKVTYANGLPAVGMIVTFTATSGKVDFTDEGKAVTDATGTASIVGKVQSIGTISIQATLENFDGTSINFTIHSKGEGFIGIIIGCIAGALVIFVTIIVVRIVIKRRHHRHHHGVAKAFEQEHLLAKS